MAPRGPKAFPLPLRVMAITLPTYDPTDAGNYPGDGPLRVGGESISDLPQEAKNLPSTLSKSASSQRNALIITRDLWAGNERIKDKGPAYLPKAPGEDPQNYSDRLSRSVFFNVFRHTVEGLAGFVFRKDPVLGDDVPPSIKAAWENIDLAGTHGDVFARDLLVDALTAGHAAILVEFPETGGTQTHGEEKAVIRPYWVPIKKDNILSWRTTTEQGRVVLTQLVLQETACVADGAFGEKEQTLYRVFTRDNSTGTPVVSFKLLGISDDKKVYVVKEGTYGNQDEIPVAEIPTSGRCSLFESTPPLIDLAYLNIAHYQAWSDDATSRHMTCVPILFTAGFAMTDDGGNTIVVGCNSGLNSPDPAGKAEYVSHNGAGASAQRDAMNDLKADMASMGIAMLATEKRVAETAEAKRIGKADTDSSLGVTARGVQDGCERALGFHAKYLKLTSGGSIKINRDFEDMAMPADLMTAWATLASALSIPVRVVLEALQEGGRIAPDVNLDDLEAEIAANAAAKADQEARAAKDLIAMKQQQPKQIAGGTQANG